MNKEYNDNYPRKVLITGASSGIGMETAKILINSGHSVFVTGRDNSKLNNFQGAKGSKAGDLTSRVFVSDLVDECFSDLGGLDSVIHCAGIGLIKKLQDTTDQEFVKITNTNLRATFLLAKETLDKMSQEGGGRFLFIPGILGKSSMPKASAYCASKFGAVGLLKALDLEYRSKGIQFSFFYMGGVNTTFWNEIDMKVIPEKMIPVSHVASVIVSSLLAPKHLVTSEITVQPQSHQL
jgi:short-subunit dehydrogenase